MKVPMIFLAEYKKSQEKCCTDCLKQKKIISYSLGRPAVLRACSTARTYVCGFSLSLSPFGNFCLGRGKGGRRKGRKERSAPFHTWRGKGRGEKGPKIYTHATTCLFPTFFSRFFAGHECTHTLGFSSPKVSLRKDSARRREIERRCETRIYFRI